MPPVELEAEASASDYQPLVEPINGDLSSNGTDSHTDDSIVHEQDVPSDKLKPKPKPIFDYENYYQQVSLVGKQEEE